MASRDAAFAALFALVSSNSTYGWRNTPARRVKLWSDVPANARPALFQGESGPQSYGWTISPVPKRTAIAKLIVYVAASDANPGGSQLSAIMDAIDAVLFPPPGQLKQTLGGAVDNCRVKSVPFVIPGDVDGDGMLVAEVELILP